MHSMWNRMVPKSIVWKRINCISQVVYFSVLLAYVAGGFVDAKRDRNEANASFKAGEALRGDSALFVPILPISSPPVFASFCANATASYAAYTSV